MTTPIAVEINCTTGEVTERPLTSEEIAQREADAVELATQRANQEAKDTALEVLKTSAKAKLVAGEPLTEEEASVLVI